MNLSLNLPRLISKTIIVLMLCSAFGVWMHQSNQKENIQADELTLEKYTAGYEEYKASLKHDDDPISVNVAIMIVLGGFVFAMYEGLSWLLSLPFHFLLQRLNQPRQIDNLLS
jgi:hypothetical protein